MFHVAPSELHTTQVKVALKHNEPSDPLDVLEETEKLFVKQKIETMEAVANAVAGAVGLGEFAALGETANKYDAYTSNGGKQFKVVETSERCSYDRAFPRARKRRQFRRSPARSSP